MTVSNWIEWCSKEMNDTSLKLSRQGYNPFRIEQLQRTTPEFATRFTRFLEETEGVMQAMVANPDGYHHFESFTTVKMRLLEFTSLHRAKFLEMNLAHTA